MDNEKLLQKFLQQKQKRNEYMKNLMTKKREERETCECGTSYSKIAIKKHLNTKKHQDYLRIKQLDNLNEEQKYIIERFLKLEIETI